MAYQIEFVSAAVEDLKALRKSDQVTIIDRCRVHLMHEPTRQSKSRIKELREDVFPPYRLRADEFRVFYDVDEEDQKVIIHGIAHKDDAQAWLAQSTQERRQQDESGSDGGSQGEV